MKDERSWSFAQLETKNEPNDGDALAAIRALGTKLEEKFSVFGADLKKVRDELDAEVAKRNRPGTYTKAEEETERKAFDLFLRKGKDALEPEEVKALRVSDDTSGGYLSPPEFSAEVDKNVVQFSPVRTAARVGPTSASSVIVPKRTGRPTGRWVGETEQRAGTQSAYGQTEVPIDEMSAYVDVSNKLLEDAAADVPAEIAFDLGEEFGRLEGNSFTVGDGVKKPLGFMSDTNVSYTASGSATLIQADGLIDLFYALLPYYRQRGVWMLNGSTLAKIRKLKDGQGQYLWMPGLAAGQPETILGRPVVEAVDMPDVAGDAYPVAFGDFTSYRIYDRVDISILRDSLTQAIDGVTRFVGRKRVGARLIRPEAIRKLKIAAS